MKNENLHKRFIVNLVFLIFINLLIKPFWIFGIDRTVQNIVGAESYGLYAAILNFSFLFNIFLDIGINNFNNKNIAQHDHLLNKYFSSILILKFLLAFIYFTITFVAAVVVGYKSESLYLLVFLAFNQFLSSLILYFRSNISALLRFKLDSILSVLDRFIMIIICSLLIWGKITKQPIKIEWFVYSQTISYLITVSIAFAINIKLASFKKLKWNYPFFISIIKNSMPYATLILLMALYSRLDTVFIERILNDSNGKVQAGIYAHAYRLVEAFNNFSLLFSMLLLPIFARLIRQKQSQSIENIVKSSFSLLFTSCTIVISISLFYSYEIMDLMYNNHIVESAQALKILIISILAYSTTYIFGTLLTASGKIKSLNILSATAVLLNIILNIYLIPIKGATGAAIACIITQLFMAIAQVIVSVTIFKIKINYFYLFKITLFAIASIASFAFLKKLDSQFSWVTNIVIMSFILLIFAILLHFNEFKKLNLLLKK